LIQNVRAFRAAVLVVIAAVFGSVEATAQFGGSQFGPMGPGMGGMGGPMPSGTQSTKKQKKKKPNEPETHAAAGASEEVLPAGTEPSLPARPLKIPKSVAGRIGSDAAGDEPELGRGPDSKKLFLGLYYQETSARYRFRTLFPLWVERTQPSLTDPTKTDRASLFGGLYYNRRSAEHYDDVLFPVFWNLGTPKSRTTPGRGRTAATRSFRRFSRFSGTARRGDSTWWAPGSARGKAGTRATRVPRRTST
jgi:hypothetical protein